MNKAILTIFAALLLTLISGPILNACSVCKAGDNLFCMCDKDPSDSAVIAPSRWRLSLQSLYGSKSNALDAVEGPGTESQREFQPSAKAAYDLTPHLTLAAELPVAVKRLEIASLGGINRQTAWGLGDAELSAVWSRPFTSSGLRGYSVSLAASVKLPTGNNDARQNDQRLDEHLQPGTGSYDWQSGIALSRGVKNTGLFTSVYYRHAGTNRFLYHYGNTMLYNLGIQRHIGARLIGSGQINGRYARWDTQSGTIVENTGGTAVYLTPGVKYLLGRSAGLLLNLQLPIYQHLYGVQSERAVLTTGITFDLL